MANPHRGEVDIDLEGLGKRKLVFDYNAYAELTDNFDVANLARSPFGFARAALAAGLSRDHHTVSLREAGRVLEQNEERLPEILKLIMLGLARRSDPTATLESLEAKAQASADQPQTLDDLDKNPTSATPV